MPLPTTGAGRAAPGTGSPTLLTATIEPDGATLTLVFTAPVTEPEATVDLMVESSPTFTYDYNSGDGTTSLTYVGATILFGAIVTMTGYGLDGFPVTNNSTQ